MKTTGRTREGGRGSAQLKKALRAFIGFVGFMLSPFTPWNDAFVNVPLAIALAVPLSAFLPYPLAYALSYAFTDILGIALMVAAGKGIRLTKRDLLETVFWGVVGYVIYMLVLRLVSA